MTTNPKKISVEDCQGDLCCVSLTRDAPVEKKELQRQHHLYYHHHHLGWDAIGCFSLHKSSLPRTFPIYRFLLKLIWNQRYLHSSFWQKNSKKKTYSSHCSDHSAWGPDFSLTEVWNFSFPKLIVTKASFVPARKKESLLDLKYLEVVALYQHSYLYNPLLTIGWYKR